MKNTLAYLLLLCLLILFNACDETNPEANITFQHLVNGTALDFDSEYQLGTNNTPINLDIAQFYIHNIRLSRADGGEELFDEYHLITPTNSNINLGEIEEGEYTTIKFDVGVDSSNNHIDPSILDASDPLAVQVPSMHWSSTAGYKFLRIDGTYDSDEDGMVTDTDTTFLLHLGLDSYVREATVSYPFEAVTNEVNDLTIKVDYAALFDYNIEEKPEVRTGMANDFHNSIVNRVPAIFSK